MDLLQKLYYDPKTGLQSASQLRQKALLTAPQLKSKLTHLKVKQWLQHQSTQQIHYQKPPLKHYFPIKANHKDHIWQIDLMDVSAMAHHNSNVNYLLCAIDIYTRYAWVRPLKKKDNQSVTAALRAVLEEGRVPQIIMSDNGSEFISRSWKTLLKTHNVESSYAEVGDKHRMGIVERFNRTIRGLIMKYCTAYSTNRFIDALPLLVENYNNSKHSSIGSTPANPDPQKIESMIMKRDALARKEKAKHTFAVGDKVRFVKNKTLFEKGALPTFSKTIHTIKDIDGTRRVILDNGKSYLYYQLQKANIADEVPDDFPRVPRLGSREPAIEPKRVRLAKKKEGIADENVLSKLRERTPQTLVVTNRGEVIRW
jgi:transposase InsO family protein